MLSLGVLLVTLIIFNVNSRWVPFTLLLPVYIIGNTKSGMLFLLFLFSSEIDIFMTLCLFGQEGSNQYYVCEYEEWGLPTNPREELPFYAGVVKSFCLIVVGCCQVSEKLFMRWRYINWQWCVFCGLNNVCGTWINVCGTWIQLVRGPVLAWCSPNLWHADDDLRELYRSLC